MKKQAMGINPLGFIKDTKDNEYINLNSNHKIKTDIKESNSPIVLEKKITKIKRVVNSTSQRGLPENWTRATYIVRESLVEKLKAVAYWDRKQVKQVVEEAFLLYLADKNTKPIPISKFN